MFWTLELASHLEDAPWPATKDELIDYSIRSGAPLEVIENLQELEDEGEIYEGLDELFAPKVADLLTFYIKIDDKSLASGMATTHPELHEFARDTFRIRTCLTTPLNFPLNMDTEPKNSSSPSHLYPLPPQFTNIS
jgi:hypothetical protein